MTILVFCAALFGVLASTLHVVSILVAAARCRPREKSVTGISAGVSVVRPVCGLENCIEETLRSTFRLAHPRYEILFCVASAHDPVIPLVERLIAEDPVRARLLIGDDRVSANPKLNNVVKGWRAAVHDWIVIADSNVLMPPDYLDRLLAAWRPDTGVVSAPPLGCRPDGFWAALECAFLNTYQARWQYLADTLGWGFVQGKTMLWRRELLEAAGGIAALGREAAEDAAATKLAAAHGARVRLVDAPFEQPLGTRRALDVWNRQVRWARLRRASFPLFFIPEILSGAAAPALCCALLAWDAGLPVPPAVAAFLTAWYLGECWLARRAGWHLTALSPVLFVVRDLVQPAVWLAGWQAGFVWRGNAMRLGDERALSPFSSGR